MSEDSDVAAGRRQLRRLETFLDVAYAVLFVDFIMYLPHTEDMAWEALPYGLLSLLIDNSTDLLRLIIAVGLTLISWNLTHKLLGQLDRTNPRHTLLCLLQLIFVACFCSSRSLTRRSRACLRRSAKASRSPFRASSGSPAGPTHARTASRVRTSAKQKKMKC